MPESAPNFEMVTVNRQAYHDYFVDETIEAGIALTGTEVKSPGGARQPAWLLRAHQG